MAKSEIKIEKNNVMREIKIEKVILSCGGVGDALAKSIKLLKKLSKRSPAVKMTNKRIPGFGIRPKLEVGCMVTLRGNEALKLLERLLASEDNQLRKKQIQENHFSFGIKEYIEIPGEEYDREIGMSGLTVTVVFVRRGGKRVIRKKIKQGKLPKRQNVKKEEIISFMKSKFKTNFK
jgi:large subunit ribosomal protein L5